MLKSKLLQLIALTIIPISFHTAYAAPAAPARSTTVMAPAPIGAGSVVQFRPAGTSSGLALRAANGDMIFVFSPAKSAAITKALKAVKSGVDFRPKLVGLTLMAPASTVTFGTVPQAFLLMTYRTGFPPQFFRCTVQNGMVSSCAGVVLK